MDTGHALYDAVCFHAQQCVEKYLNALLQENGTIFPRTHNLVELLDLGEQEMTELLPFASDMNTLTREAVEVPYPGKSAEEEEAR